MCGPRNYPHQWVWPFAIRELEVQALIDKFKIQAYIICGYVTCPTKNYTIIIIIIIIITIIIIRVKAYVQN